MAKFDYIIMNPPYDGNLHLDVLNYIKDDGDKIVNISPIHWIQNKLNKRTLNKYIGIANKIEDLEIIPYDKSNVLFDIATHDLGISTLGKGGYDYLKLSALDSISQKIKNKVKISFEDISTIEGTKTVPSGVVGMISSHYGNFNLWVNDSYELFSSIRFTCGNKFISFKTEDERRNCFDYLQTKLMRYYAKQIRQSRRVAWKYVPVLDWSKHWSDEDLYTYFGITEDEIHTYGI